MGAYLSHPITEKCSSDSRDSRLKCGASSMQGWRVSQEDAHNCILDFNNDAALFAVYDGHGGKEVAEYAADKLPDIIKNIDNFKQANYAEALKEAFLEFDNRLIDPAVVVELKVIADNKTAGTAEDDMEDENIRDLHEEASMPLEQLMERYRKHITDGTEEHPASPFLRGKTTSTADSSCNVVNVSSSSSSSGSGSSANKSVSSSTGDNPDVSSSVNAVKISSSCDEPCSSSGSSTQTRKSLEEKYCNGEVSTSQKNDVVTNGEVDNEVSSSVDNGSKKKKKKANSWKVEQRSMLNCIVTHENDDSSSDTDESFAEGSSSSDDDDVEAANNDKEGGADDDEEVDDDDEEDDDDDDDDDDEEEEEDEQFSMKMTDELAEALKEGRLVRDCENNIDTEDGDDYQDGIGPGFLMQALKKRIPGADSGCTAVVALVLQDRVWVANAGDSRCVACRDGQAVDLSVDHKPEDDSELERIVKAGGKVTNDGRVNGGLNLSRALGDHVYKKVENLPLQEQMISPLPDIQEITITDDLEFLILACDGIWNFMSSQEVVNFVRQRLQNKPERLSTICEELFDHCLAPNTMGDGTGCDNMTAVIVQFRPEPEGDKDTAKRRADAVDDDDDGDKDAKDKTNAKRTKTDGESGSSTNSSENKTETSNLPLPSTAQS